MPSVKKKLGVFKDLKLEWGRYEMASMIWNRDGRWLMPIWTCTMETTVAMIRTRRRSVCIHLGLQTKCSPTTWTWDSSICSSLMRWYCTWQGSWWIAYSQHSSMISVQVDWITSRNSQGLCDCIILIEMWWNIETRYCPAGLRTFTTRIWLRIFQTWQTRLC